MTSRQPLARRLAASMRSSWPHLA